MTQSPSVRSSSPDKAMPPIYISMLPESPIGPLWVAVSDLGLAAIEWSMSQADFESLIKKRFPMLEIIGDESHTREAIDQLSEYLAGNRREFDLLLDLSTMTRFQLEVLHLTFHIPYGQTSTYKDIAIQVGKPRAARAVGRVEATNPIPLVIPCHRVLGSDGSLHGYGGPGGIKLKAWLLQLEGAVLK
jgi:O-6-methylguanine DNA methyltransferase